MISDWDRIYFERRYAEETSRAALALVPGIAEVHLQLAELYRERLDTFEATPADPGGSFLRNTH